MTNCFACFWIAIDRTNTFIDGTNTTKLVRDVVM